MVMPIWMKVVIDYKRTRGGLRFLKSLSRDVDCDDFMLIAGPVDPGLIGDAIGRYIPVNFIASNDDVNTGDW